MPPTPSAFDRFLQMSADEFNRVLSQAAQQLLGQSLDEVPLISGLKIAGWREDDLGGELPALTNRPEGQLLCTVCGSWQDEATFEGTKCRPCQQQADRDYQVRRRQRRKIT